MIIINLKGGLGNQMFQYALGRKLSIKNSDELKLDITGLEQARKTGDTYRTLTLNRFHTKYSLASAEEANQHKYRYGIFSRFSRFLWQKIGRQFNIGWEPWVLKKIGNMYLDGYWQSPRYFDDIRDVILEDFTLVDPLSSAALEIAHDISSSNSVSILVRRGDYISNPKMNKVHGTCSVAYYEAAIKAIETSVPNPKWFVFSDDLEWVKANLPLGSEYRFCSGSEIVDYEQLTLMSLCKHNIIANSSFGWWGAWLNRNPNKVVFAPTPWFNTRIDHHKGLIPDTWKKLPRIP